MKVMKLASAPLMMALAGCMTASRPATSTPNEPLRPAPGLCDASAAQSYVGQAANAETGTAIREASRARTLRWGPPDSVWTMDYRDDRVNVRYDRAMVITTITCG